MKNITLLFCLFLANILLGACSGGEDEKKEMDENQVTIDEQAVELSQKSANTADARDKGRVCALS